MARNFSDAWLDELRSRNDIVQVVSAYTQLQQKGRKHWGLCPFHSEKTASFSVDVEKQLYYCFGCHAGGNVIHFVMNIEHMAFPEAVEYLAEKAGMDLPEDKNADRFEQDQKQKQRLYEANKLAARYFYNNIKADSGKIARDYLAGRGISAQFATHFGLGYSLNSWDGLLGYLVKQGFQKDELVKAGLCLKKENYFDFFRNRLMFPIIDQRGRVLGFGGRMFDGDTKDGRKYMNTSDTPIYNKRASLYGLNFYKDFGNSRELILVEGYMDLLAVSGMAGYKNVVATLGTALTSNQTRLIRRFADRVYIAYDGDAAGRNATLRGLELAEKDGLDVKVLAFPDGKDPDDFIRDEGSRGFEKAIEGAMTLIEYRMLMMKTGFDLSNEDERMKYTQQAAALLKGIGAVETERYLRRIADETGYSKDVIKSEIDQQSAENTNTINDKRHNMSERKPEKQDSSGAERLIVKLMAEDVGCINRAAEVLEASDFNDPVAAELFSIITSMQQDEVNQADVLTRINDGETAAMASQLFGMEQRIGPEALDEMLARVKQDSLNREMDRLLEESASADQARKREIGLLVKSITNTINRLKNGIIGEMRDDV